MISNIKTIFDSKSSIDCHLSSDFSGGMYLMYSSLYSKEFDWLVEEYINDKFGYLATQIDKNVNSKRRMIKNKFKGIAFRYNCVKEFKCFLNVYRFFSGIVINFKNFILCSIKFVFSFILSVIAFVSIAGKFLKRKIFK